MKIYYITLYYIARPKAPSKTRLNNIYVYTFNACIHVYMYMLYAYTYIRIE